LYQGRHGDVHSGSAERIIAVKLCNACFPKVELSDTATAITETVGVARSTRRAIDFVAKRGYWVGGSVTLTDQRIVFVPNALNSALQDGNLKLEIRLTDVTDVRVRFGILTKIIEIVSPQLTLTVRCFGATSFAGKIDAQRRLLSA